MIGVEIVLVLVAVVDAVFIAAFLASRRRRAEPVLGQELRGGERVIREVRR